MDTLIVIPEAWVPLISAAIPFVIALATRAGSEQNGTRSLLAFGLSAVVSVLGMLTDGQPDSLAALASNFGTSWFTQLGTYLGAGKALGINDKLLPGVGLNRLPG